MDLIDELSRLSSATDLDLHFPGAPPISGAELWRMTGSASAAMAAHYQPGEAIGIVLAARAEVLACLIGAWRAGLTVASLPAAPRGASTEKWSKVLTDICVAAEASCVIAGLRERYWTVPSIPRVEPFSMTSDVRRETDRQGASFVQCTSGTTSHPRGVRLSMGALAANVQSILDLADLGPNESVCSVLPLSHDMGLVGMVLTGLVGMSRQPSGGRITLFEPRDLRLGAGAWAQACSTSAATITAATPTMLDMTTRWLERDRSVSFHPMRICFVGSEPIPTETLDVFQGVARRHHLNEMALSPAYGLAEATLAVSVVRPGEHWESASSDLLNGSSAGSNSQTTKLVCLGRPLPGISVDVTTSERNLPELCVDGPAMFSGYLGTTQPCPAPHRTGDIGFLANNGQVVVAGRATDFIRVATRDVSVVPFERHVAGSRYVRSSACAVFQSDLEAPPEVVFEPRSGSNLLDAARFIHSSMQTWLGQPPGRITALERDSIEFSHSGKLRRSQLREAMIESRLHSIASFMPSDL